SAKSLIGRPGWVQGRRRVVERLKLAYADHDHFALVVTAASGGRRMSASLAGRRQAEPTAAAAAELGRQLVSGEIRDAGVWLPEQIVSLDRFFEALSLQGYRPTLEE